MSTQISYAPITWRVEYLPPGGSWTLLVRETAPVDGLSPQSKHRPSIVNAMGWSETPTLSKSYRSPAGAVGTWKMRVVVEENPDIVTTDYKGIVTTTPAPQGFVQPVSGVSLRETSQSTITGKATSKYKRSYNIRLPAPGPWDIKVVRDTPDSTSSALANESWFDSIAEIVESKLSYPNSALAGLSVDAEQFSDIPTRGYEIYGIKCQIPSNYNPITRSYSGIWDGTFVVEWTNNPAWVYYDLLTNRRYGLGQYINTSGIDKWSLYEIAQYCDGMIPSGFGYLEPRFTCNLYIQTREAAYKVLASLTSVFRGMAFWSAGQVTAVCDMPTDAVSIFTNANVIDGSFNYAGSSRAARHTVALVTWNDPDNAYKQTVEYVEDIDGILRYGINQTEVVAFGCTSRGQAHRMGKWILYTERLESEVISWKTGLEGTSVYPGAIVKVADNLRSGDRIGGRSLDATPNSVTLDAPVTLVENTIYTLSVVLPEGGVSDHTVTTAAGTTSVLHVTPNFSATPQIHSMWVLASVNLNPQTFRVLSVKEAGKAEVEVTALQHDPNKFAMIEYDAKFNPAIISSIKSTPDTPTGLQASDTLFDQGPGLVGIKLHFSWEGRAARFDVRWKQGDNNVKTFSVTTNYADISPVSPGITTLQVRGVSVLGSPSKWATLNYGTLGKLALPGDVTGFTATSDQTGVNLKWDSSPEIDVNRYELRFGALGSTWEDATSIGEIYATSLRVALAGETTTYLIKAIDTSGNKSANAATSTVVVGMPATPTLSAKGGLFSVKFDWAFGDLRQDIKGTELWWSPSTDNRTDATRLTFEPFPSSTYTQIGLEPGEGGWYWIRVVDNFGNASEWNPSSATEGLHAVSETDPTSLLTQLEGALGMPQLAAELAEPIERLSDINLSDLNLAIDSLFQSVANNTASVETMKAASAVATETVNRDTAVKAETSARETLAAKVSSDIVSAIQTERTVTATAVAAEASARETLAARMPNDIAAAIQSERTVTATAIAAEASKRETLQATVGENTAAIQSEASARSSVDNALVETINTIQASLGNNIASVQQTATASADAITGLYAKWSLKTQVMQDGQYAVAGIELLSSVPGQSTFAILADRFLVYQPNGQGAPKQVMTMGTVNGVTALGFNGSAIFDGSVAAKSLVAKTITASSGVIDDLAVNTMQIAGFAVTTTSYLEQSSTNIAAAGNYDAQWSSVPMGFNFPVGAQSVVFIVNFVARNANAGTNAGFRIRRSDGTVIVQRNFTAPEYVTTAMSGAGCDSAPLTGFSTYTVELFDNWMVGGPWYAEMLSVTALATLK